MERVVRKNNRLRHFDYSNPGFYFITICTHKMKCCFGTIENSALILNRLGKLVEQLWMETTKIRSNIELHEFVVMPNHFHAIVQLTENESCSNHQQNLGNIIKGFKSSVTSSYRKQMENDKRKIWQRGYNEHIVRNEQSLLKIREYVVNNPLKWELDRYFQ